MNYIFTQYLLFFLLCVLSSSMLSLPCYLQLWFIVLFTFQLWMTRRFSSYFPPFVIEFISGALLYNYRHKLINRWLIPLAIIVAIVAISYRVNVEAKNGPIRVFTFGVASFAIVMIALVLDECGIYKAGRVISALGDSSYTLYLSHLLLIQSFYMSGIRTYLSGHGQWVVEVGFTLLIIFCLAFSHVFYLKVELPLYKTACGLRFWPMQSKIITKYDIGQD